ncbi:MAG: RDD family protein [Bacilli bacterium]
MKKTEEKKEEKVVHEVEYARASTFRRISAGIFDFFTCIITSLLLFMVTILIIENSSVYKTNISNRNEILLNSELYVENDANIIKVNNFLDSNEDLTYNEKSERMDTRLNHFFVNKNFFEDDNTSIYNKLKSEAKDGDNYLFDEGYDRVLTNTDYDATYYEFYKDAIDTAVGYLNLNSTYSESAKTIFVIYTVGIVVTYIFPYLIFFLLIPLIFKTGYQTLGKKIMKIAIINFNGVNANKKKFLCRFAIFYFFEIILSLVTFLIPFIVSISMMVISKTHQSLHDYVCGTYVVSVENNKIYRDVNEILYSQKKEEIGKLDEDKTWKNL